MPKEWGWDGYGVCSNLQASSGEPPASQNHFNYWLEGHSVERIPQPSPNCTL